MKKFANLAFTLMAVGASSAQLLNTGNTIPTFENKPLKSLKALETNKEAASGMAFGEGVVNINIGYGWPNLAKTTLKLLEEDVNYNTTGIGPIAFRFEYGLTEKFGLGLSINYSDAAVDWSDTSGNNGITYNYKIKRSTTSILPRFNFHFGTNEKVDPYFAVAMGFRTANYTLETNDPDAKDADYVSIPNFFPIGFEAVVGVRIYFTPNIGAYSEIGISKGVMQAGLAFKF